jgi:hypothetical protein
MRTGRLCHRSLLALMSLVLVLAGCSGARSAGPVQPAADRPDAPGPGTTEQATLGERPVAQAASGCQPLTERQALFLLVRLSGGNPTEVLPLTAGTAHDVLADDFEAVAEGWPSHDLNAWRKGSWKGLSVTPQAGGTALATLNHTDYAQDFKRSTRFEFTCQGGWMLTNFGPSDGKWFQPDPGLLPGQDGPLTEELALALFNKVYTGYAYPRIRHYVAYDELERAKMVAVAFAGGATQRVQYWDGVTKQMVLVEDRLHVNGEWIDEAGKPTDSAAVFMRIDGVWKMVDRFAHNRWGVVPAPYNEPWPMIGEHAFMGFELGMSRAEVAALLPSRLEEAEAVLQARGVELQYLNDFLVSVSARSGATRRGLKVGDPAASALSLYGKPNDQRTGLLSFWGSRYQLLVETAPDAKGVERVTGLVYRYSK